MSRRYLPVILGCTQTDNPFPKSKITASVRGNEHDRNARIQNGENHESVELHRKRFYFKHVVTDSYIEENKRRPTGKKRH
jgi:hypothetical protein